MRLLVATACCFLAAACASAPSVAGPTTTEADATEATPPLPRESTARIDDPVDGSMIALTSAVAIPGSISAREPDRRGFRIVLANHVGFCAAPAVVRPGARSLTLDVESRDLGPRTYTVPEPLSGVPGVHARLDVMMDACRNSAVVARAGSLTIEDNDGVNVRGSFDLVLGNDRVRGRFDAIVCETPPDGSVDLGERCDP